MERLTSVKIGQPPYHFFYLCSPRNSLKCRHCCYNNIIAMDHRNLGRKEKALFPPRWASQSFWNATCPVTVPSKDKHLLIW